MRSLDKKYSIQPKNDDKEKVRQNLLDKLMASSKILDNIRHRYTINATKTTYFNEANKYERGQSLLVKIYKFENDCMIRFNIADNVKFKGYFSRDKCINKLLMDFKQRFVTFKLTNRPNIKFFYLHVIFEQECVVGVHLKLKLSRSRMLNINGTKKDPKQMKQHISFEDGIMDKKCDNIEFQLDTLLKKINRKQIQKVKPRKDIILRNRKRAKSFKFDDKESMSIKSHIKDDHILKINIKKHHNLLKYRDRILKQYSDRANRHSQYLLEKKVAKENILKYNWLKIFVISSTVLSIKQLFKLRVKEIMGIHKRAYACESIQELENIPGLMKMYNIIVNLLVLYLTRNLNFLL